MNKTKIISVGLLIFLLVPILLIVKNKEDLRQKAVFTQKIKKVLGSLVVDLNQARDNILIDVPADGQWHKTKRVLIADNIGDLRIRRLKENPDILEVQIESEKNAALIYNLRIRIRS